MGSTKAPSVVHDLEIDTVKPAPHSGLPVSESDGVKRLSSTLPSAPLNKGSFDGLDTSISPVLSPKIVSSPEGVVNSPSSPKSDSPYTGGAAAREVNSSNTVVTNEASITRSNHSDLSMNSLDDGPVHDDMHGSLDFRQYFQEGYCKASSHDEFRQLTDIDSSHSPLEKEKSEDDGEIDDMLGGVFSFSEEGG
ncbi:unnamed protein product [Ilex paraguariensis]|uniref:Uncharacterized protein n=1 Tax=Ilex paraguariensis TaxID=185542 RepID=A0ABC8S4W5_9AQUA